MVKMYGLLAIALVTIGLFPDTTAARTLRLWLIERPAAALSRFGLGRTIVLGGLILFGLFLFWVGEAEGVRLFAMMAPEALTWMALFDAGAVIDLVAVVLIAGGAGRIRPALQRVRLILGRSAARMTAPVRRASRAVRSAVRRIGSTLRNDADDRPAPGRDFGPHPAFG